MSRSRQIGKTTCRFAQFGVADQAERSASEQHDARLLQAVHCWLLAWHGGQAGRWSPTAAERKRILRQEYLVGLGVSVGCKRGPREADRCRAVS